MRRWSRLAAAAAIVVAAGAAATWAVRRAPTPTPLAVTGTIEATQVAVSAKLTGRVAALTVREGQPVERGQLLIRLDAAELEAEVQRAAAAVAAAEAELRDLEAGARPEEIREAEARAAQAQARLDDLLAGARRQEVEQARAALRQAEATREWAERDLTRIEALYRRELVAAQELDRARRAWAVAVADETAARERLALLEAGPRPHELEAARAELRAARERVALLRAGPRPQELEAARARLGQARAALELARARLAETRIHSPLTGVVLHKHAEVGETASPGVALLTLVDPNDVWLRAWVPEPDVGRVRLGQAARVTVDAYPDRTFPGRVTEIASEAEFTPRNVQTRRERANLVFRIKITVTNVDGILKPGMPADAVLGP